MEGARYLGRKEYGHGTGTGTGAGAGGECIVGKQETCV